MNGYGFGAQQVQPVSEETAREVRIAQYILISTAFINLTSRDDTILVIAAFANIVAILLLVNAAFREAREQPTEGGGVTPANRLKIIGTGFSLIANLALTSALLKEVSIRRQGVGGEFFIPPTQPSTGAFTASI